MNRTPLASPASNTGMMWGWSTAAAALDSLMKRCRNASSMARPGARIFSKLFVSNKLVSSPVKQVAPRLQSQVHDAAGGSPKLRRERVGLHFELLDRVN